MDDRVGTPFLSVLGSGQGKSFLPIRASQDWPCRLALEGDSSPSLEASEYHHSAQPPCHSSSPEGTMLDPSVLLRSMASAFERVVKSVIRELDQRGELIPVDSLQSSTSFQPYCLLVRKPSRSWFWRHRYKCVNLSIRDILEPNAPEPGTPPGTASEPWVGGEQADQLAICPGPLGSLLPEGRTFSKVPQPGWDRW